MRTLAAGARSRRTASSAKTPTSHNGAFCSGSLRPVSGKHERVPSLSGTLHAPGVARFIRAVQVSAANTASNLEF
jgi:hypothetical protein